MSLRAESMKILTSDYNAGQIVNGQGNEIFMKVEIEWVCR